MKLGLHRNQTDPLVKHLSMKLNTESVPSPPPSNKTIIIVVIAHRAAACRCSPVMEKTWVLRRPLSRVCTDDSSSYTRVYRGPFRQSIKGQHFIKLTNIWKHHRVSGYISDIRDIRSKFGGNIFFFSWCWVAWWWVVRWRNGSFTWKLFDWSKYCLGYRKKKKKNTRPNFLKLIFIILESSYGNFFK